MYVNKTQKIFSFCQEDLVFCFFFVIDFFILDVKNDLMMVHDNV